MSTAVSASTKSSRPSRANSVLRAASKLWFVLAVSGQLIFAVSVAAFYGVSASRGNWDAWNKSMSRGHIVAHPVSNSFVALHLLSAVALIFSGAIQLVPAIQRGAPRLHRWNGRLYLLFALSISVSAFYMIWIRGGVVGALPEHLVSTLNILLVLIFGTAAWRSAVRRDFRAHRSWALRLYVVALGVWFLRLEFALWEGLFGSLGIDDITFTGWAVTLLGYGAYLIPLGFVELYLRAQQLPGTGRRWAMASLLLLGTLITGAGAAANTIGIWIPTIRTSLDSRKSIADTLYDTLQSAGISQAVAQYHSLQATHSATYNFDEGQLDSLGYRLIHAARYTDAISILKLNAEAFPKSSNACDSLGEAYLDAGNTTQAIANYQKSVQLDPKNISGAKVLARLNATRR